MKVLLITDDRSSYKQGYYYTDWINIFKKRDNVTIMGPGYSDDLNGKSFDFVIIGHGAIDWILGRKFFLAAKYPYLFGRLIESDKRVWMVSRYSVPIIMFSKNDYKANDQKKRIAKLLSVDIVITHSLNAVSELESDSYKTIWLPFSYNSKVFFDMQNNRSIDIGFRGNLNDRWNDGERARFINEAKVQLSNYALDIKTGTSDNNFLFGMNYSRWMGNCTTMLNTASAIGTVGPKWWEQMACGTIPLAPVNFYEGQLIEDINYIAINSDFSNLSLKFKKVMLDKDYREEIKANNYQLVKEKEVGVLYDNLMLEITKLISFSNRNEIN
jgi:hypothetical protein